MHLTRTATFCVAGALAFVGSAPGQTDRDKFPDPGKGYRWEEAARKRKLDPADVERLKRNKLLMTNEAFKQVFDPYIKSDVPVFITSDSLLNAFHVLYEESVLRLESANARKLPGILRFIWKNLAAGDAKVTGDPKLTAAAKRRAQAVIGVALKLVGDESVKPDAKLAALIDAEVKRVVAATGRGKPEWLGPPDRGFVALDYTRYKPRGFYTKSKDLERYFRAVSWLQSIPFRVDKDEELLAILMLGNCVTDARFGKDFDRAEDYEVFFRCFNEFVGSPDDWDLTWAAHHAQNVLDYDLKSGQLARDRASLLKEAGGHGKGPKVNDQLCFAPLEPGRTAEVHFRILSPYRVPDAVLFQRTTDPRQFVPRTPSGLELCAALGAPFARERLTGKDRAKLLATIDGCKPLFSGSGLYARYLRCLAALLAEPERDAPALMATEPWKVKSCQAALAGWAQLRHTWALQAKLSVTYLGLTRKPHGFVEPNPELFARMAELVGETERVLGRAGAFEPDTRAVAEDLRALVALLKKKDVARKGRKALETLSLDELALFSLLELLGVRGDEWDDPKFVTGVMEKAARLAEQIEKGEPSGRPKLARALRGAGLEIGPLWRRLEGLCRRLEALAHKQLRGVPFSEAEQDFLIGYGEQLAGVMLYGGNAYLTPRDDAPRVVDVFHDPSAGRFLEVGIARARALYVLYPVKGGEVLCRGAVLPYYEFTHPRRLTDAEWKALLDSKERPAIPSWVKPIVGRAGITVPELKDGH
jgi:hypothetical protein